jgi:hypothetical protein
MVATSEDGRLKRGVCMGDVSCGTNQGSDDQNTPPPADGTKPGRSADTVPEPRMRRADLPFSAILP